VTVQDRDLVPQHQDLRIFSGAAPCREYQPAEHSDHQVAAAILWHLNAVITTGQTWDPVIATHGTRHNPATLAA